MRSGGTLRSNDALIFNKGRLSRSARGPAVNFLTATSVRADKENFLKDSWFVDRSDLIGRDRELTLACNALDKAARASTPAILHIVGEPGIGKTLFTEHLIEKARLRGWFTIATTCHEIHRHTPFIAVNRLVLALLQSLGADANRYTSGLEDLLASLDPAIARRLDRPSSETINKNRYQSILLRLFDGIGSDHNILIACDDAQWIDAGSRDVLHSLAAGYSVGPLALVFAERLSGKPRSARRSGETIALEAFDAERSAELACGVYPKLAGVALETAVAHGNGNPFEILTLCEELTQGHAIAEEASAHQVRDVIAGRVAGSGRFGPRVLADLFPSGGTHRISHALRALLA